MAKLNAHELLVQGIQKRTEVLTVTHEKGIGLLWELGDIRARVAHDSPLGRAIDEFREAMDLVECTLDPTLNMKGKV